jgi:excisionase family DNA binding protein
MERLLTIKEVADLLSVSIATLYEWSRQGLIPSVKLSPKALRFSESEINDFISKKSSPPFTHQINSGSSSYPKSPRTKKVSPLHSSPDSYIDRIVKRAKDEVLDCKK